MKKNWIPLDAFAEDTRPIVKAFRDLRINIKRLPLRLVRHEYKKECGLGSLPIEMSDIQTFTYPADKGDISLRFYPSQHKSDTPQPIILFIHGGGWTIGNIDCYDPVCRLLAQETGLSLLSVGYRLAPEHKYPTSLNDCIEALEILGREPEKFNADPRRIIVVGDSAGGNMATVLAHQYNFREKTTIIAEALLYPSVDFSKRYPSHQLFTAGLPLTTDTALWFGQNYVTEEDDLTDPKLSPILAPKSSYKIQSFVATMGFDPLRDEGIAYASKLMKDGHYVEHVHFPDQIHGIVTYTKMIRDSRVIIHHIKDLCDRALSQKGKPS